MYNCDNMKDKKFVIIEVQHDLFEGLEEKVKLISTEAQQTL